MIYSNEELKLQFRGGTLTEADKRLLDFCVYLLTKQNGKAKEEDIDDIVRFTVEDYAELLHKDISTKPLRDKLRRDIQNGFTRLRSTDLAIVERGSKNKDGVYYNIGVAQSTSGKRGAVLEFQFGRQIAHHLINNHYIALLHPGIFATRRGLGYAIGRYLCIRFGMDSNVERCTNDIISVKALLETMPAIPSIEELRACNDSHWQRRIQDKLERELDDLQELGVLSWEYCAAKKEPLKPEELVFSTYEQFEAAYIKFNINDEPDQSERRAKRIEKRERRKKRQEASADKFIGQAKAKQQLKEEEAAKGETVKT